MGFAEDMAELEESFDTARNEDRLQGDFGPTLPDGQHQVIVVDASVKQRESDEHWQFYLKFQNSQGTIRKWSDLDHEVGLSVAAQDLKMLGYEGKLPDLEKACQDGEFTNLVCNIGVKTKPGQDRDFTNVYLNGCLGPANDPGQFEVTATATNEGGDIEQPVAGVDDDIPF